MTQLDDTFPIDAIDRFLRERVPGLAGAPRIERLRGGASNLTYLVEYEDRRMVLRSAPPGVKAAGAHDMLREAGILRALASQVPVPRVLAVGEDPALLGTPFFVMEHLDGVILRRELPADVSLDPAAATALCHRAIDALVALHSVDVAAAGLSHLDRGEGYVERQIRGWATRYRNARTPDVPDCEAIIEWLERQQPRDVARCLVHNDFRFDNLVLSPDLQSLVGVLDWELATIGDPWMDLGASLAYWVQADDDPGFQRLRLQPTHRPGMLRRSEVVAYYCERAGRTIEDFTFYEVYGLFRLAGIAQQIYQRHVRGQGNDPRHAEFGHGVRILAQRCQSIIDRGPRP